MATKKEFTPDSSPDEDGRQMAGGADTFPRPDPTVLTTQAVRRDISALREVLEAEIEGQEKVFEGRFVAMDKAIELLQTIADRLPGLIDGKVAQLKGLHDEKFSSIATQFSERDTRTEQTQRDSKVAVDAALQAQKESVNAQNISNAQAIAKSEANFTKLLDQLAMLINSNTKTSDDKIDDLKARVQSIEGKGLGIGSVGALVVGAAVVIAAIVGFITFVGNHSSVPASPQVVYVPTAPPLPSGPNGAATK
jgi:hypothetical protein